MDKWSENMDKLTVAETAFDTKCTELPNKKPSDLTSKKKKPMHGHIKNFIYENHVFVFHLYNKTTNNNLGMPNPVSLSLYQKGKVKKIRKKQMI